MTRCQLFSFELVILCPNTFTEGIFCSAEIMMMKTEWITEGQSNQKKNCTIQDNSLVVQCNIS